MNILYVSSEIAPFVKTGGLGDVAAALPRALSGNGHHTISLAPLYGSIDKSTLQPAGKKIAVPMAGRLVNASLYRARMDERREVCFLDQPKLYGNRPNPYGDEKGDYPDNDRRFIFFSRAVIELAKALSPQPDIIHINDWQAGLAPLYLKLERENGVLKRTVSVFSIHNLGYQGHFKKKSFNLTGLPESLFTADGVAHHGKLGLLKAGIVFADAITTVSRTYAREILTPELGFGLENFLQKRKNSLTGILNGIDTYEWNPEKDRLIPANFSVGNMGGKAVCRHELLKRFGMVDDPKRPLIGMVSRLIEQKGFGILKSAAEELLKLDLYLVVLGTGQRKYEEFFKRLSAKYPERVGVKIGYDNALAHQIEAGADIFLMPSMFEPCGLNQMYSLRYGTVPIVRATGGLNDTVKNWNRNTGKGNGFVFKRPEPKDLIQTLKKTIVAYGRKREWKRIIKNGMAEDNSWERSAKQYIKLYQSLLRKAKRQK